MSLTNRFIVYPLPEQSYGIRLEGYVLPTPLSADADVPVLPSAKILELLLPLAREKLALNSSNRRYTGPNIEYLTLEANRARAQLTLLCRSQRDIPGGPVRLKRGW